MNQKDWVDHFEALHNRKPSIQEFQAAREVGEFLIERKETSLEEPASSTVASQEKGVQLTPSTSSAKRFHVNWNKQTKWGVALAGIVAVVALVYFFFLQPAPSLDGVWIADADTPAVVYELNGKQKRSDGKYKIQKVYKENEAQKEFQKALDRLRYSKLKTLADVDKKFDLHTREIVIIKDEQGLVYNLLQNNGTNVILVNDLIDLVTYSDHSKSFKKKSIFHKTEIPKVLIGKWKSQRNHSDETNDLEINDHGVLKNSEFDLNEAVAFYSLEEVKKMSSEDSDQENKAEQEAEDFQDLQDAVDSLDYKLDSMKDVYLQAGEDFYYVSVNGGKTVLVFTKDFYFVEKLEKVK